jgi:hypothetical protein
MHKCIYCRNELPDDKFQSRDHIFLKSLGGQAKLEITDVCHECNKKFGKYEQRFIYDSLISVFKQANGPRGRRGKFQTKVHFMFANRNEPPFLGVVEQGIIPKVIPQLRILDNCHYEFHADPMDGLKQPEEIRKEFFDNIKGFSESEIIFIEDNDCPIESVYLCIQTKKLLAFVNNEEQQLLIKSSFKIITGEHTAESTDIKENENRIESHQRIVYNEDDYNRIICKMVLNCICHFYGKSVLLADPFSEIIEYVYSGANPSKSHFVSILPPQNANDFTKNIQQRLKLPDKYHMMITGNFNNDNSIIGFLSLYNAGVAHIVKLNSDYRFPYNGTAFKIFINDYDNKNEYELFEEIVRSTLRRKASDLD